MPRFGVIFDRLGAETIENGAETIENGAEMIENGAETIENGGSTIENGAETIIFMLFFIFCFLFGDPEHLDSIPAARP